jgi:phosphoglycerol transferase MdoB-like AlkP superfamily enzyme
MSDYLRNISYSTRTIYAACGRIIIPFFIIMFASRLLLYTFGIHLKQVTFNFIDALQIFGSGFINDAVTFLYFFTLISIFQSVIPNKMYRQKCARYFFKSLLFIFIYSLLVCSASEFFFWEEFGSRFNFIAVDYLVYRREVVGNINESYPVIPILFILIPLSAFIYYVTMKAAIPYVAVSFKSKSYFLIGLILATSTNYLWFDPAKIELKYDDQFSSQLSQNGIYSLFSAYLNNVLDYDRFYVTMDEKELLLNLRKVLNSGKYISEDLYDISRRESATHINSKYNIMLIAVESLSAEYLEFFGNDKKLTPYIDSLISDSLNFSNYYATGTRTVRGLESMTLSIPPTSGNSIVRRPNNENLFSIGSVMLKEGYDNKFIYGGFGYFDNMNYFFANNNFKTIDRSDLKKEEITFANIWGVADEDIFKRAVIEADKSHKENLPFFTFIMTTSNHRPFTYPDNTIDIPSGSPSSLGREGAVKYSDYSIKKFIEFAKTKPWFKNTVFVITADHCAGSSGKSQIPVNKYHIPLIIYSPQNIKPRVIKKLSSQMDLAPTLLSLLGVSYNSKFFGSDILSDNYKERALLGTYKKLGYMKHGNMVVLGPKREIISYNILQNGEQSVSKTDANMLQEAITYYQSAYLLIKMSKIYE